MRLDIPPTALRLNTRQFVAVRKRGVRVVDPKRGHQYEIEAKDVEYTCPICHTIQAAPPMNGVDYECPGCNYHYKVYDDLLCVWNPESLGVKTLGLKPGTRPLVVTDDNLTGDEIRAEAIKEEENKRWNERGQVAKEHIQILTPEKKNGDGDAGS